MFRGKAREALGVRRTFRVRRNKPAPAKAGEGRSASGMRRINSAYAQPGVCRGHSCDLQVILTVLYTPLVLFGKIQIVALRIIDDKER
jgi:hypothetical protein